MRGIVAVAGTAFRSGRGAGLHFWTVAVDAGSIDCLVWDPIHVADVGRTSQFYGRYVAPQNPVKGDNVTHLYACFLEVADWLVRPRTGVCLVKLCDQVHSARQQWQVLDFVWEARICIVLVS